MSGTTRQFEPHITRSGGIPSKYRFTVRCSECPKTESYEANQSVGDEVIKGYFKERSWLLGRDRSFDLCPTCLAKPRDSDRRRAHGTPHPDSTMAARHSDRGAAPMSARHKDTAEILARHLGKPEALAAEVFRPKTTHAPGPTAPEFASQPTPAPALPPEIEQVLTGMATDLKSLRSTMELMAEQMGKLVAVGAQQIEAIARLTPVVVQSADRLSGRLQEIVHAVRSSSEPSDVAVQQQPISTIESQAGQDWEVSSEPEPEQAAQPTEASKQARRPGTPRSRARQSVADQVVVKSIADAKRPDRFYTTIRLPRELWDKSGFGPEDRIQLDWKKKTVSINRVSDGGVKPKSISDAVVVLQSWRLGDLTFAPAKITAGDGTLRLTSP